MTENEIKLLFHLNKVRSQNNVDNVLSEMLSITEYDLNATLSSLLEKKFIYEDGDTNQKNLKLRAWKITPDGEVKVNEIQRQRDLETEKNLRQDIKSNTKSTNKLAWATFFATLIGTVAVIFQANFANQQNKLIEKQINIQEQKVAELPILNQKENNDNAIVDSILNIVEKLELVKKQIKLIDSLSKGKRHISLVPTLDDSLKNIYLVQVGEQNDFKLVTYFNFLVDANSMTILNPTGKLEGQ